MRQPPVLELVRAFGRSFSVPHLRRVGARQPLCPATRRSRDHFVDIGYAALQESQICGACRTIAAQLGAALPQQEPRAPESFVSSPKPNPIVIYLVEGSGAQQDDPAPAQDLFVDEAVRLRIALARAGVAGQAHAWYVVTTGYGLAVPEAVLEPYPPEVELVAPADRRDWGRDVIRALACNHRLDRCHIVFLTSLAWRRFLQAHVAAAGCTYAAPNLPADQDDLLWLRALLNR